MGITSITMKVNNLTKALDNAAASAGKAATALQSSKPAMEEVSKATDTALSKLLQAADAFGGTFGTASFDPSKNADGKQVGLQTGGFVTAAYAVDIIKQYVAILNELNSKSDLAMDNEAKLRMGLWQLEGFFQKFFPQFGQLTQLVKEWQDEMNEGVKTAKKYSKSGKGGGSKGSSANSGSSSSAASSSGIVL